MESVVIASLPCTVLLLVLLLPVNSADSYHSSMSSNVLDPAAICALLPTLLPQNSKKLNFSHDGIAALVHTALSALAFRLIAVDESSTSVSSSSNVLPEAWNQHGPGNYTFRYKHDQSSLEFCCKSNQAGRENPRQCYCCRGMSLMHCFHSIVFNVYN